MRPEAVVFDVGRVLIGWDPEGFYDRTIGPRRRERLFAEVDLHATNAAVDAGAAWRASFEALAERHPAWARDIMLWCDCWVELTVAAIEHSVRLLRALRHGGIPVYALTNFGAESFALARTHYDFLGEFDGAVVSGEIGTTKPGPGIYAHLEAVSGRTGNQLLFTDDVPANIATAHARGWRTHLFTGPEGWADRLVAEGLLTPEQAG
jgi:2-haloacid dehalogenase